jgi:hypothetical protein
VTSAVSAAVCLGWIAVVVFLFRRVAPAIQAR